MEIKTKVNTFITYENSSQNDVEQKRTIRSHVMRYHRQNLRTHREVHGVTVRFAPVRTPGSVKSRSSRGRGHNRGRVSEPSHVDAATNESKADSATDVQKFQPWTFNQIQQHLGVNINHRAVDSSQCLAIFLNIYWSPSQGLVHETTDDWLSYLPFIELSVPLLQLCVEAMCYAKLAEKFRNEECLKNYRSRYGVILPLIAREICRRGTRPDHLLLAILILLVCELNCPPVYGTYSDGWLRHTYGALQYVQSQTAASWASPLGHRLLHFMRHFAICSALQNKRNTVLGHSMQSNLWRVAIAESPMSDLHHSLLSLPGLLERLDVLQKAQTDFMDELNKQGDHTVEQTTLTQDFLRALDNLGQWRRRWKTELNTFQIESSKDKEISFTRFESQHGPILDEFVIVFSSVADAPVHLLHWLAISIIVRCILSLLPGNSQDRILSTRRVHGAASSSVNLQTLGIDAAISFCRAMPYCLEAKAISLARYLALAITQIERSCLAFQRTQEAAWCRDFASREYTSWEDTTSQDRITQSPDWEISATEMRSASHYQDWVANVLFINAYIIE